MTKNLKIILVTGASSGFGKLIAERLAADGHRVFGTSRQPKSEGGAVTMLPLDVMDDGSAFDCVHQVIQQAGRIDILVNNAGFGLFGAIEDTSIAEAMEQLDTNFWGVVRMTRLVLPHMRREGSGRIINIGSMAGHVGLPYQPYYSVSKYALEALNECLRLELKGSGVDATIVCPGDFKTGFTSARRFASNARSALHKDRLDGTLAIYEQDELLGADPILVADLVAHITTARATNVRYFVGKFSQRASIALKRFLPARLFERLLKSIYQLY